MLQDFLQVDLLGAGVRKRYAPPFVHAPPPRPVVPRPRSHTLPLCPHLGAHRIPPPHFRTPAPLARSTLRPGCASPCSHTLRASTDRFPGCTAHRSVPPPLVRGPLACGPPLTHGPSRAALLCRVPSLRVAPSARPSPCAHPRPSCASGMRAKGRAGVVGHPNGGGRGAARGEGTAANGRGGHRPWCPPGMRAKGEGGGWAR